MSPVLLALLVVVAVYVTVASGLSLLVAAGLPRLERALPRVTPPRRAANLWLALALAPAVGGLLSALLVALPSWTRHEPRGLPETPGPVLLGLAGAGFLLGGLRLCGALRDHGRTSRLVSRWVEAGRDLPGLPLPATRVTSVFPVAAVYGIWRPRLFLSDTLLRGLEGEEARAVVEHELAHARVRENLRRFLLRASPDPLAWLPAGARLRALFDAASEAAADRAAADRVSPLLLAQALLKTAALVPPGGRLDLAFAAFHREGGIAARVEALLRASALPPAAPDRVLGRLRPGLALTLLAALLLALASASSPLVHRALEGLVHLFA